MTQFTKLAISKNKADELYLFLRDNIEWEDAIRARYGFTRKAKRLAIGTFNILDEVILPLIPEKYKLLTIYLNYYEDGNMFAPTHTHPSTFQLVLSLGETRTLIIDKVKYSMESGDVVIFGPRPHSIPKEEGKGGRISIAVFLVKI